MILIGISCITCLSDQDNSDSDHCDLNRKEKNSISTYKNRNDTNNKDIPTTNICNSASTYNAAINNIIKILICTANVFMFTEKNEQQPNLILDEIRKVFNKYKNKDISIFIVGFQEVVNKNSFDENLKIKFPEFDIFHSYNHLINATIVYTKKNNDYEFEDLALPRFRTERSAGILTIRDLNLKIANTHLYGGKYDDTDWYKHANVRKIQIQKIINNGSKIIIGDFNTDANEEKNKKAITIDYWKNKLQNRSEKKLLEYLNQPHSFLKEQSFIPIIDRKKIKKTTPYSNIVDWIYVHKDLKPKILKSFTIDAINLGISDHNFVVGIVEITV